MFFARRSEAPALEPSWFRGLRFSLNTPVVRTDGLPVAPARAALVLFEAPEGPPGVLVGVRSLKSGQVVHFEPEGTIDALEEGLDAAMAFGEGMGFLFDDDELEEGEAERAFGMWHDLMGELDPRSERAASPGASEDELLLTEALGETARPDTAPTREITQPAAPPDTDALASLVESALADAGGSLPPVGEASVPMLTKFRSGGEFEDYALTNPSLPEARPLIVEDFAPESATGLDEDLESDAAHDPEAADELLGVVEVDGAELPSETEAEPAAGPPPEAEAASEEPDPDGDAPVAKAGRRRGRGRAALGRLRLVKKRLSPSDESKRQFLARILSEF